MTAIGRDHVVLAVPEHARHVWFGGVAQQRGHGSLGQGRLGVGQAQHVQRAFGEHDAGPGGHPGGPHVVKNAARRMDQQTRGLEIVVQAFGPVCWPVAGQARAVGEEGFIFVADSRDGGFGVLERSRAMAFGVVSASKHGAATPLFARCELSNERVGADEDVRLGQWTIQVRYDLQVDLPVGVSRVARGQTNGERVVADEKELRLDVCAVRLPGVSQHVTRVVGAPGTNGFEHDAGMRGRILADGVDPLDPQAIHRAAQVAAARLAPRSGAMRRIAQIPERREVGQVSWHRTTRPRASVWYSSGWLPLVTITRYPGVTICEYSWPGCGQPSDASGHCCASTRLAWSWSAVMPRWVAAACRAASTAAADSGGTATGEGGGVGAGETAEHAASSSVADAIASVRANRIFQRLYCLNTLVPTRQRRFNLATRT